MFLTILINFLLAIHIVVSLLIIFVTLMQRPKSEGLGAAFGGGMTENFFGAQTTNVLATFTRYMGGIFFALTLILSVLYAKKSTQKSAILEQLTHAPKPPAAAPAPAPKTAPAAKSETAPAKPEAKPVPAVEVPKTAPAAETPKPEAAKDSAVPFNNEGTAAPVAPVPQAPK